MKIDGKRFLIHITYFQRNCTAVFAENYFDLPGWKGGSVVSIAGRAAVTCRTAIATRSPAVCCRIGRIAFFQLNLQVFNSFLLLFNHVVQVADLDLSL